MFTLNIFGSYNLIVNYLYNFKRKRFSRLGTGKKTFVVNYLFIVFSDVTMLVENKNYEGNQ